MPRFPLARALALVLATFLMLIVASHQATYAAGTHPAPTTTPVQPRNAKPPASAGYPCSPGPAYCAGGPTPTPSPTPAPPCSPGPQYCTGAGATKATPPPTSGNNPASRTSPLVGGGVAFADNFNRPDGPIGAPWVQQGVNNEWSITNQQALGYRYWLDLTYDAGSGDGTIIGTLVNPAETGYIWLAFRYVDGGNYWIWGKLNGTYQLGRFTSHSFVVAANTGIAPRDGDVLTVVMNGPSIVAMLNGAAVAATNDSTFETAPTHGLGAGDGGGASPLFDTYSYSPTLGPTSDVVVQPLPAAMAVTYQSYGGTGGDPVQTFTGNFGYSHTDLAIAGRGPSPTLVRTANNADPRTGPLGLGWTDNYAIRLTSPGDGTADLLLVGPKGGTDRYTFHSGGTFTPPPAVYTALARNADGTYTATLKDQTT